MKISFKAKLKKIAGTTLIFVCGMATSIVIQQSNVPSGALAFQPIRSATEYRFISPLLALGLPKSEEPYQELADTLRREIDAQEQSGGLSLVSVYFHNLKNGRWTGINENAAYDPASLLKLAESTPDILDKELIYRDYPGDHGNQTFNILQEGVSYPIRDLLSAMIIKSDNGARYVLLQNIDLWYLKDVYSDLGIEKERDSEYKISAKAYSLFFRVLYNSTYLSRDVSEAALNLLSHSDYNSGIVSGLPTSTVVAHKFGKFLGKQNGASFVELHDCGIVYYTENPYFLCVMTRGSSLETLQYAIQKISQVVFNNVSQVQQ